MNKDDGAPKPVPKKLQKLIDACAKHGDAHFRAMHALDEYCMKTYGHAPSDIDCDPALDSLYGNSGSCQSIPAEQFDADMLEALKMWGRR